MSKYGFAIVGCGNIAPFHAEAIERIADAKLVAVCDNAYERAEVLARKYGADLYSDYSEMLKREDIDIVNICLPSGLHEVTTVQAANAGKHVIVEKPLDITLTKCNNMIKTCEANNVKLCVIFPERFTEVSLKMKQALEAGRFGKLTLGDAHVKWYRSPEYYNSADWRGTWEWDGGGALMNQSIHYIDLLISFMGDIDSVFAYCETLSRDIDVEDTAVAVIKFKNGAIGTIEGTTSIYPGFDSRIGIHGDKGSAIIEGKSFVGWKFDEVSHGDDTILNGYRHNKSSGAQDPTKFLNCIGHLKQIRDMIEAIDENRKPLVDGYEGSKAVEAVLAIYKSARENKPVKLPY